jgi:4-hydroxy-4-methyl-2-oxoglutarate aldolase
MREATELRQIGPAALQALREFDTATLYESAKEPGFMGPEIRPIDGGYRVVGTALTVACPAGDNLMLHAAVADAAPGEVLVVQCHDATFGAWGEVLMTSAQAHGIAGLIIDGGVRDIEAMRAAKFPVFSRSISIRGAAKRRRGVLRQPISCGGVLVWPGDIVVADDSGVAVIPAGEFEDVLAQARQRQKKEAIMMKALQNKQTTLDLLELRGALEQVWPAASAKSKRDEGAGR